MSSSYFLAAGTAILAGHSRYRVGLTRCASIVESNFRTLVLTFGLTNSAEADNCGANGVSHNCGARTGIGLSGPYSHEAWGAILMSI
jgi:hypothetical protein